MRKDPGEAESGIAKKPVVEPFGVLPDGTEVHRYTLFMERPSDDHAGSHAGSHAGGHTGSKAGPSLTVTPYGATMLDLRVPDRSGNLAPVILSYRTLEEYLAGTFFVGATVGRVAGRITEGRFVLDGQEYRLERNDPPNHLHGGSQALDRRVWTVSESSNDSVTMRYHSPDGEEGYPGAVDLEVRYRLVAADSGIDNGVDLVIETRARSDAPTPLSTTNHAYFNLSGGMDATVDAHYLSIDADHYTPADEAMTLLGMVEPVAGTAADLRRERPMGEVIPALHRRHGDNYLLGRPGTGTSDGTSVGISAGASAGTFAGTPSSRPGLRHAARAKHPGSGRVMDVLTDAPCLQFFGGEYLTPPFAARSGFCLECQGYPDGPNHPEIDDIILRPGELYRRTIVYRFSTN